MIVYINVYILIIIWCFNMVSFRILKSKNKYEIIEPIDDLRRSFGFNMVVNPKGEVLKFFKIGSVEAFEYLDYVSLSRWDKLKYWLNYKRRG